MSDRGRAKLEQLIHESAKIMKHISVSTKFQHRIIIYSFYPYKKNLKSGL